MEEFRNSLPSGWDSKWDEKTGKYYYINHYTKTTTWDDPRDKNGQMQGTPKQAAKFPMDYIPLQEIRSNGRGSLRKIQDTTFASSHSVTDYDDSVTKISAMFPTVSETHIKLLLKKYLNREALVISALQVEKYPIATPGPFSTPPPQRNIHIDVKDPTSRTASPILGGFASSQGYKNSPKTLSSPKLKLRYMKSIFPNADETIILECLQNNENNIQKTTETLKEMGYSRKEIVKASSFKVDPKVAENVKVKTENTISTPLPKMKTSREKRQMKEKLQEAYEDVPEHLISIALESVNFDETRANQILAIMRQEDNKCSDNSINKKTKEPINKTEILTALNSQPTSQLPASQSRQSIKSLLKSEKRDDVCSFSRIMFENGNNYKSINLSNTKGHTPEFSKGPNEKLLLENYIQWQGPNKSLAKGPQGIARGSNRVLISTKTYSPCGPNISYRKGPSFGITKSSIFTEMKA